ncbi:MAG TPA: hypothetical protein VNU97_20180 [Rhizomicrobium sp.]|jgi:hypothetical protein|nr:hypothetical protein [Rhizomicrobium sp.]
MFHAKIAAALGAAVLLAVLMPATDVAAQSCNCAQSTLTGTSVGSSIGGPTVTRVVGSGVELPNAGPTLGAAGSAPRWNIDFGANTIRIDFINSATYGMTSQFVFSGLNPAAPAGCSGTPQIAGITVTTNKPGATPYVVTAATFTAHTVTLPYAPTNTNVDWAAGQYILATLRYDCAPGPATGNACCPPWDSTALSNAMVYQGTGGIAQPYTLKYTQSAALNAQMEAYVAYLHTLNAAITSITVGFQLVDGGTGTTSVPGSVLGTGSVTWTSTTTTVTPPNFFAAGAMQVNHWYRVRTVTALNNAITFFGPDCVNRYIDVRLQFVQSLKPGAAPTPAMLQIRPQGAAAVERSVSAARK